MSMTNGTKATRQRGNEATRQEGNEVRRQPGNEETRKRDTKGQWVGLLSAVCLSGVGVQESFAQQGACCTGTGQCVRTTETQCTDNQGSFVGVATSCAPGVCPGACCQAGGTCVDIDGPQCFGKGGLYQGLHSECADTTCMGACCLPGGACVETNGPGCSDKGGLYQGLDSVCAGTPCLGACCLADGSCTEVDTGEAGCDGLNETFTPDADCTQTACAGACCLPDGSCMPSNEAACSDGGGNFALGADCLETDCDGACCLPLGDCVVTGPASCDQDGGLFAGFKATCENTQCMGACCLPDKTCFETGQLDCDSRGGSFAGGGTACGTDCPAQLATAFTWQAQLKKDGRPLDGTADFVFTLFNQPAGGEIVGELEFVNVAVVDGLFTVELDFGPDALDGNARWLEIQVRSPSSKGTFETLSPRQPLTATPYALQTRGIVVDADRDVGIGTKTPQATLHVNGATAFGLGSRGMRIREVSPSDPEGWSGLLNFPGIGIGSDAGGNRQMVMVTDGFTGQPLFTVADSTDGGLNWNARLAVKQGGNVGIGPVSPSSRLHVEDPTNMPAEPAVGSQVPFKITDGGSRALLFDSNQIESVGGPLHLNNRPANDVYLVFGGGRVGIGTNSPGARLHVNGTTRLDGRSGVNSTSGNTTFKVQGGQGEALLLNVEQADGDEVFQVQEDKDVFVIGDFFVNEGAKLFVVDHPLDPANKSLLHNTVEGPGYYTFYRGNVVLDADGEAWVELPEYFDALNAEPSYQLTCVGGYAPVYVAEEIRENRFKIAGGRKGLKVSWQVTGLRDDPWARDHPFQAVVEKEAANASATTTPRATAGRRR